MSQAAAAAPNLMFSHMGFAVSNLPKMEEFDTRVLVDTDLWV